jgi:hypothetical protein
MNMKKSKFLILAILFFLLVNISVAQIYYVNTYGNPTKEGLSLIFIKAIDLERGIIIDSVVAANYGYIWQKTPVQIVLEGRQLLLTITENGGYAKNSYMGPNSVIYAIVRAGRNMTIVRRDSIDNVVIDCFDQYPGDQNFRFGLARHMDSSYTMIFPTGEYTLGRDFSFIRLPGLDLNPERIEMPNQQNFRYLHRLNMPNLHRLYRSISDDSHYWILRLNSDQNIVDSLMIDYEGRASSIYAYHPAKDRLYVFHLNYEQHGKFREYDKNYGQDWIVPEVQIYDPSTFQLLESHRIADFDSGSYPLGEHGLADVVGNYIVYYFFEDEWMGNFNPAMLFIFDTRTNQATWLRVGWR